MTDDCDHLRVRITRVISPYDENKRSRFIGGHCEDCGTEVGRLMTKHEIATGEAEDTWHKDEET